MSGLDKGRISAKRQLIQNRNRTEALTCMMRTIRGEGLTQAVGGAAVDTYLLSVRIMHDLKTAGYSIHRFKYRTFK